MGDFSLVGEGNLVIFCYIDTIDLVCICLSYVKGPSLPWSYSTPWSNLDQGEVYNTMHVLLS
jgi:hypothetical protein